MTKFFSCIIINTEPKNRVMGITVDTEGCVGV